MTDFAPWTVDDSQKTNISLTFDADINYSAPPSAPPGGMTVADFTILRVSLVMPTPSLDSWGRPT